MTYLGLLAAGALLLGNALFVAAEFAAVSARRAQIEPLAERNRRARRTLTAQRRLSLLLAGAQLGITLCSLGLGAVAEPTIGHLLEGALHSAHLPVDLADPLAFAVALTLVVLAHMVLGEMVPKNIALARAERAAVLLVPALDNFVRGTRPLLRLLNGLANTVLRLFRVLPQDELKSAYTADELAEILAESRSEGLIPEGEHERMHRVLGLQQRTASDVAIPIDELLVITTRTTAAEIERLSARSGFSRFPVIDEEQPNRLLGFVHVKDLLTRSPDALLQPRPMPEVPSTTPLSEVLGTLRRARSHLGVVEQSDVTIGAIALEDVLEEITGEIADASHPAEPA
jgi:CBS domain containing-hemolysin-like protein